MPRYVDADALIAKCKEIAACDWNKKASPVCWSDAYEQFADDVEEQPAADVVEVVRCGQCKEWDTEKNYCHHPAGLCWTGKTAEREGFCCFGERRVGHGTERS